MMSAYVVEAQTTQHEESTQKITTSMSSVADEPTVQELAAEIESLKKKSSTWDKILSKLPKVSGYIQVGFDWRDGDKSNFFVKRARVKLAGQFTEKLDYSMLLEFASFKLLDVYVRYRPVNAFNLQIGKYRTPLTLASTNCSSAKYEFIAMPQAVEKLSGGKDLSGLRAARRDLGVMAYGGFWKKDGYSILNYNVGVFNGEGLEVKDANKSKDFVGRLTLEPIKALKFSGSYHWGEFGENYLKRERYSAGMEYVQNRILLRGEWVGGWTGDMKSSGWFASAGYWITPKFMGAARYDTFLEDVDKSDSRQTNYTLGVEWRPIKPLRCQFNYTFEDLKWADNHHQIAMMITAMF